MTEIDTKTEQELIQEKKEKSAKQISALCWALCIVTQAAAFYFAKQTYHISLFLLCPAVLVCPLIIKRVDSRVPPLKHVLFIGTVYFIVLSCGTIIYTLIDNHVKIDYAGIAKEYAESVKQNAQSQQTANSSSLSEIAGASSRSSESDSNSKNNVSNTSDENKNNTTPSSLPSHKNTSYDEITNTAYATPNGKRYHYKSSCAGINAVEISWNDISERELTPCGICAKKDLSSDQ